MRVPERSTSVLFLVLCLTCAGCGAPSQSQPSETTVSPAPVPVPEQVAPGVSTAGISNLSALEQAHYTRLQNTSYTSRSQRTVTVANGTMLRRENLTVRMRPDRFSLLRRPEGSPLFRPAPIADRFEFWVTEREGLSRVMLRNGSTRYDTQPSANSSFYQEVRTEPGGASVSFIDSSNTRTTQITRNGRTLYRVTTNTLDENALYTRYGTTDVRNVSLTALVTPEGVIQELDCEFTIQLRDREYTITRSLQYADIGNTTVVRPPWYEEAIAATNVSSPSEQRSA